ncbi:ABC transporter, ATP-binding protein [[Clostridium] hylemonae DSM 15053]|uniref:ABC transporter, ATP-binding protein n=2 Tax=[Clostridium] hylemonae TaxID=89153 RepID=C0C0L7_9FIRM|nr:ABC transporter, ATP-binding protein [[Clostridium] hylemonae DSM 15053]QEK19009.1 Taurine import ATP-binding protein TauB [[Clostridium] hylemonae DSM 15053]
MNMGEVEKKTQSGELNIEHVSIEFNTVSGDKMKALDDISLDVAHGELVAVVGRSGCGKTTLLNIVAGLLEPTGGTCRLNGKEITGPGRERGVVFQADAVFGWKRVGDNVDFALKLGGVPKEERGQLITKYLKMVNLEKFTKFYPKELSGGMRKRLQIAMVLANQPKLLLMDEPFGPLDYATKVELQVEVEKIRLKNPLTTFFVTHDVEEATFVADRIIMIEKGKIVEELKVDIPRPRPVEIRNTAEFHAISDYLLGKLLELSDVKSEVR